MKFVGIVGTNAEKSTNRQLLQYMQRHFAAQVAIDLIEVAGLPAFDEPESGLAPDRIQAIADQISAADGVIIATPEYDHAIPAVLKSLLEWLSYTSRPLIDKPVLIVGASYGALGSSRAQAQLRQILDAPELKARLMPGAEFLLSGSLKAFDDNGDLNDPEVVAALSEYFAEFQQFVGIVNLLLQEHHVQTAQHQRFSWEAKA